MAINFPATGGQPTDGSFTYTVAGITYSWNGESWTAAGAGASATDRTLFSVNTNAASGTPALSYDSNTGVFDYTPPDISTFISGEVDTLDTVTGRGASTANALTLTKAGTGLTLTGGAGTGRLDVQNAGAYAISLNAAAGVGINTADGVGLNIGNIATNTWRAQIDGSTGQITGSSFSTTGSLTAGTMTVGGLTYPTTNGNPNDILTSDGAGNVTWGVPAGLQVRQTASSSGTITGGAFSNSSINMAKTVALLSITSNSPAWVVLYADTASRTADANRSRNTSPAPGSGVLAEVIFTASGTQLLTPGLFGFSPSGGTTYYTKITNDGPTGNVSVDFTYVQLEA